MLELSRVMMLGYKPKNANRECEETNVTELMQREKQQAAKMWDGNLLLCYWHFSQKDVFFFLFTGRAAC